MVEIIFAAVITLALSIIGYQLAKKDSQQEDKIKDLYTIHTADCARLRDLELKVAQEYHNKNEIHDILNDLKTYLKERFDKIEGAIYEKRRSGNDHL